MTEEERTEVKEAFDQFLEIQDRKKQLNEEAKDVIERASKYMDVDKSVARKYFNFLKTKHDKGVDQIELLKEIDAEVSG